MASGFIVALLLAPSAPSADAIFHGRIAAIEPVRERCDDAAEPVAPIAPAPPEPRPPTSEERMLDAIEGPSPTSEAIEHAKAVFNEAQHAAEEARHEDAMRLFVEGYRLAPNLHAFLINVGMMAEELGRCALARHAFVLFLERDDGPRDSVAREMAQERLQRIDDGECRDASGTREETSCIYGVVRGRCGAPFPGAVSVSGYRGRLRFATDDDGRFAVCNVPAGEYDLTSGHARARVDVRVNAPSEVILTGAEPPIAWSVQLDIDHVHRGDRSLAGSSVVVRVPAEGTRCVPGQAPGDQLVYARREADGWIADACSGFVTQPIAGPPRIRDRRGCQLGSTDAPWWMALSMLVLLRRRRWLAGVLVASACTPGTAATEASGTEGGDDTTSTTTSTTESDSSSDSTSAADSTGEPAPVESLVAMTFNVLCSLCSDGFDPWDARVDFMVDTIDRYAPDLVGLQEVLTDEEVEQLRAGLGGKYEPVYYVGVDTYADALVFYDPARFELLDTGTYWLSPTPDNPFTTGFADGLQLPRLVVWTKLVDLPSGRELVFATTHFDNNAPSQELSAPLVLERTQALGGNTIPTLLVGDFNSQPYDPAYAILTEGVDGAGFHFQDVFDLAAMWSVDTNVRPAPRYDPGERIDHMFVSGANWHSAWWTVDLHTYGPDALYPSDHFAMAAELSAD